MQAKDREARSSITLRFLAEPADINFGGKVHGGAVMKWIDGGAYACASAWSGKYCVTAYVGGIRFIKPILIGSIVEVEAKLIFTGNSSMHIAVDVYAYNPRNQLKSKTSHCVIVFVAVDEDGKPTPVQKWKPMSSEETALEDYAKRLMEKRENIEKEMQPFMD